MKAGESIVQDYLEGGKTPEQFLPQSKVWFETENERFLSAFEKRKEKLAQTTKEAQEEAKIPEKVSSEKLQPKLPLKVATNYELIINKLTSKNYEIVKGLEEANIAWLISSLNDEEMYY